MVRPVVISLIAGNANVQRARHPACATLADVGTPKVVATKKFLEKIAPWATYVKDLCL